MIGHVLNQDRSWHPPFRVPSTWLVMIEAWPALPFGATKLVDSIMTGPSWNHDRSWHPPHKVFYLTNPKGPMSIIDLLPNLKIFDFFSSSLSTICCRGLF